MGDVVFFSHIKGKRRSTVLLFGNRTFLVCSLAAVIHGTGLRTHPPLAWNWVLQDEIERARVSFLAAMCQLLGEGVRKRGQNLRQRIRGRAGPCWFAGRAWWVGFAKPWGTTCARDNALYGFLDIVAPPFNAVQLHNPRPSTRIGEHLTR